MSYSMGVPNVKRDTDMVELQDRINATCDAVGVVEDNRVRNRIRESANIAFEMINRLELEGDAFNLSLSGHVKDENDPYSGNDYATVMVMKMTEAVE